jgi:hypothetical protein
MSNFVALVVEGDPFQREILADLLKSEGLEVVECADAAAAELVLASTGPNLLALVTAGWRGIRCRACAVCQATVPGPYCCDGLWTWPATRSA